MRTTRSLYGQIQKKKRGEKGKSTEVVRSGKKEGGQEKEPGNPLEGRGQGRWMSFLLGGGTGAKKEGLNYFPRLKKKGGGH